MAGVVDVKNINKVQLKGRAEQMNTNNKLLEINYAHTFKTKARHSNYSPESIELTWEEIEDIPCITEKEIN